MGSSNDQARAVKTGGLVVLTFGFIFVEADAAGLRSGPQGVVRGAAFIVALVLFGAINRAARAAAGGTTTSRPRFGRQYWMVVAAEVVALFAGLVVINGVARAHELTVPWIAVVVGVHFFAFVRMWENRAYAVLGVVVTALGVAGFVLYADGASAVTIRVVSGIGSGVALYLASAYALVRLRRSAVGAPDSRPLAEADR
jgi:cyanate permease